MKKGLLLLFFTVFSSAHLLGMKNSRKVDNLTKKLTSCSLLEDRSTSLFTAHPKAIKVLLKTALLSPRVAAIITRTHENNPWVQPPYQAYDISELNIDADILSPIMQSLEKLSEISPDIQKIIIKKSENVQAIAQCTAMLDECLLYRITTENYHAFFNAAQELQLPFLTHYIFKKIRPLVYKTAFKKLPDPVIHHEILKFARYDTSLQHLYHTLLSNVTIPSAPSPQETVVTPMSSNQYTAIEINGTTDIGIYDSANNLIYTCVGHQKSINDIAWSYERNYLASASKDNTIKIWHVAAAHQNQKEIQAQHSVNGFKKIHALTWSPDGNYLAIGSCDGTITIAHVQESGVYIVRKLQHGSCVDKLNWTTNNTLISSEKTLDLTNFYAMHRYLYQQTTLAEFILLHKCATQPNLTFDDLSSEEQNTYNNFAHDHPCINMAVRAAFNNIKQDSEKETAKKGCIIS